MQSDDRREEAKELEPHKEENAPEKEAEDKGLDTEDPPEEEAGSEGGGDDAGAEDVDEETPEEREERLRLLEEARRQLEELKEEDYHPEYKKIAGLAAVEDDFIEKDGVIMGRCGECGREVPESDLMDNGNFLACKDCI